MQVTSVSKQSFKNLTIAPSLTDKIFSADYSSPLISDFNKIQKIL